MKLINAATCRRCLALALALLATAFALLAPARVTQARSLEQRAVDPRSSPCVLNLQQRVLPGLLLLGEMAELTIAVKPTCSGTPQPQHLVLVLDVSDALSGSRLQALKAAARSLVDSLDLPNTPSTRVGIVQFDTSSRTLCQLTNDVARLRGCIGGLGGSWDEGPAIDRGMIEGLKVLRQGRRLANGQVIHETMLVLTADANADGCEPVMRAAGMAKSQGVLVITVCVGDDCDAPCMQPVASSPRYFFQVQDSAGLHQVFQRIRDEIGRIAIRSLTLVTILPANMQYVPGSAWPAAEVSPDQTTVEWRTTYLPGERVSFGLSVLPLEVGFHEVTLSTIAEFRDAQNRSGRAQAANPWLQLFATRARPRPMP